MKTFRVMLQTEEVEIRQSSPQQLSWHPVTLANNSDLQGLLQLLLNAAQSSGFKTAAEEQKHFIVHDPNCGGNDYSDPIVKWYNNAARVRSVYASLDDTYDDKILTRRYIEEAPIRQLGHRGDRLLKSSALMNLDDSEEKEEEVGRQGVIRSPVKTPKSTSTNAPSAPGLFPWNAASATSCSPPPPNPVPISPPNQPTRSPSSVRNTTVSTLEPITEVLAGASPVGRRTLCFEMWETMFWQRGIRVRGWCRAGDRTMPGLIGGIPILSTAP
jgi:hypothetical protein